MRNLFSIMGRINCRKSLAGSINYITSSQNSTFRLSSHGIQGEKTMLRSERLLLTYCLHVCLPWSFKNILVYDRKKIRSDTIFHVFALRALCSADAPTFPHCYVHLTFYLSMHTTQQRNRSEQCPRQATSQHTFPRRASSNVPSSPAASRVDTSSQVGKKTSLRGEPRVTDNATTVSRVECEPFPAVALLRRRYILECTH